jgi:hypothetical protein
MTRALGFADFIKLVIEALEAAGVDYMIGGAVAAWAWGEPRATQDLDLVVDLPVEAIGKLSKELGKRDMLVPPAIMLDNLLEERGDLAINAIHMFSGFKADLFLVRSGDALRRSAFERRQRLDLGPPFSEVYLHSPEDLILYKLLYFSISQQPKHTRDIAAILRAKGDQLDEAYIKKWVDLLGLKWLWRELRNTRD